MLAACGESGNKTNAPAAKETKSSETAQYVSKNILEDANVGAEIFQSLKDRPELKGQEIMVFHNTTVTYNENKGSVVTLAILKPGTENDVDKYRYSKGEWKTKPVRITGDGDMRANIMLLDQVKLDKVPEMVSVMKEKSKDVEDAKLQSGILIFNVKGDNKWIWTMEGKRAKWQGTFDLDGNLVNYRKV
jgi:hypothetical protein